MGKQERVNQLRTARDDAYRNWQNTIVELMSDGNERKVINDEDKEDYENIEGVAATLYDCGYKVDVYVDKVSYNVTHSAFKIHLIMRDYQECDEWVFGYDLTDESLQKLLENIVWED